MSNSGRAKLVPTGHSPVPPVGATCGRPWVVRSAETRLRAAEGVGPYGGESRLTRRADHWSAAVFAGALPRQKHPEPSFARSCADQTRRVPREPRAISASVPRSSSVPSQGDGRGTKKLPRLPGGALRVCRAGSIVTCTQEQVGRLSPVSLLPTSGQSREACNPQIQIGIPYKRCGFHEPQV